MIEPSTVSSQLTSFPVSASTSVVAASALLLTLAGAAPSAKSSAQEPEKFTGNQPAPSYTDNIMDNLQKNGKVDWQAAGDGHYADIPIDQWEAAKANVSSTGISPRNYGGELSNVLGWAAEVSCYGEGAMSLDTTISGFVIDACDALVGNSVPPLVQNALRVWNTPVIPDANGFAHYLRFSAQLLRPQSISSTSLCQAAFSKFKDYCQDDRSKTQGGEFTIGDNIKYNTDPTDLSCNC